MQSGGGSSGNSVTRIEPPSYQLPYLQSGLQRAEGLFNTGGPQQYGGQTVVPFAPQTEAALAGTEARAMGGSPVVAGAQGYVGDTLGGKYLEQGNPYLDAQIGRAADTVYNQTTSRFARSGRNAGAAQPVFQDIVSDLTSRMYGDAYEGERNRQQGVLPFVTPLAEQDYRDLTALRGVGAEVEDLSGRVIDDERARYDYEQARPGMNLDAFLGRVTGNMGQTTSQPIYRNRAAGALGGALAGNELASMFSTNPWVRGIGAVGGGIFGGWG